MRNFGNRATLAGNRVVWQRLKIANANGTMIDYSSWFVGGTIADSIDAIKRGTFRLARQHGTAGTQSLAPFLSTSTLNVNNAAGYAPAIDANRRVEFDTAEMLPGSSPAGGNWHNMFTGYVDTVEWGGNPLTVQCRGIAKSLIDTQIEVVRTYGSNVLPGNLVESEIQAIFDDNLAASPSLQLGPGGSPSWYIGEYLQQEVKVYEAANNLALQIGWVVREMYFASTTPQIVLFEPNRSIAVAQDIFQPSEYVEIPELAIDDESIRNYAEGFYTDEATGLLTVVPVFDSTSIGKYGRRYIRIAGEATKNIRTNGEMVAMLTALLADLAYPRARQSARLRYMPHLEVTDYVGWAPNGDHYDSQQDFAIDAVTHEYADGDAFTTVQCSGKPKGAYRRLIERDQPNPFGDTIGLPEFLDPPTAIELTVDGIIVGWRLSGRVDVETQNVIVFLSDDLTLSAASPPAVTVVDGADTYYWLPALPAGFISVDVLLAQGGTGTVEFTPTSLHDPLAPTPTGGVHGLTIVRNLSRAPETILTDEPITSTTRAITLTARPSTALVHYRFAAIALGGSEPWIISATPGRAAFVIDLSAGNVELEYYAVSVDGVSEVVHSILFDMDTVPGAGLAAVESDPNQITVTLFLDDDTVAWELYVKRSGWPTLQGTPQGTFDRAYLKFAGNRNQTQVGPFYAEGEGVNGPDSWFLSIIGYDKNGHPNSDISGVGFVVLGSSAANTVGAISGAQSLVVDESGTDRIDVTWDNNAVVEGAAASRFTVRILENDVVVLASQHAKVDHLGTDTIAGKGGWHRPCTPSTAGAPGASFIRFFYVIELYDTGILVGGAQCAVEGWFLGTGFGTAPTTTPNVATVGLPPGGDPFVRRASWSGLGLDAALDIEVEWHRSNDNFVSNDVIVGNFTNPPLTQHHDLTGIIPSPTRKYRTRQRYVNVYGAGPWTAYSNIY